MLLVQNLVYYLHLTFWRIRFWNFCVNIIMVCYVLFAHKLAAFCFVKILLETCILRQLLKL